MQGDKSWADDKFPTVTRKNARNLNKPKVIYFYLHFTEERIERDVDEKLFSIIERTTVYILFPWNNSALITAVDQRCKNYILLIVAVKMSLKNIFPPKRFYLFFVTE